MTTIEDFVAAGAGVETSDEERERFLASLGFPLPSTTATGTMTAADVTEIRTRVEERLLDPKTLKELKAFRELKDLLPESAFAETGDDAEEDLKRIIARLDAVTLEEIKPLLAILTTD